MVIAGMVGLAAVACGSAGAPESGDPTDVPLGSTAEPAVTEPVIAEPAMTEPVTSATATSTTAPVDTPTTATTAPTAPTTTAPTTPSSSVPTNGATTAAPTTAVPTSALSTECAERIELRAAAALLVWPAADPVDWDSVVDAVERHDVGGVLLMQPRGWDTDEVTVRLADLERLSRHGLVVATDEEGGDVQRLRVLGDLASQRDVSLGGDRTAARRIIAEHGRSVRSVGVDIVLGPVVDVAPDDGDVPLAASRFFVGDANDVAEWARTYVDGWNDAGLVATLKHFPGHGAASADTHDAEGVTAGLDELAGRDLVPFAALGDRVGAGDAAVMVGHLTVPGLTDGRPATLSSAAIDLLRSQVGYADALVVSDALGMGAVGLPESVAAVEALRAGIDVVVFTRTSQTGAVVDAIVDAVDDGTLDESTIRTSARRVLDVLSRDGHRCNPT
ncbi:MAG: glycoside hydrolase family 3 N-terminal domain-containing protein [Actinomycetota bacterium]